MLKHMLSGGIIAGAVAGAIAAALQFLFVIPLILEAELYESGARVHFGAGSPQSPAGAPPLGDDWARHLMTVGFDVVAYAAFGLILTALMALAARRGVAVTARQGVIWGLAGFCAVQLAPAIGMPPELPGTINAEVVPRQIWWGLTIVSAAAALALFAFGRGVFALVAGAALLLIPQIIGAPHLDTYFGVVPPELSALFAVRSLAVGAVGWAVLGFLAAWLWERGEG
ncbi:MAG: hypothetical protein D6801_04390 [Alphaproteobacteria bacterium]|nr:MAG: hypothetical protein D6801_04390 [Alphaproteobacteria bacterium]